MTPLFTSLLNLQIDRARHFGGPVLAFCLALVGTASPQVTELGEVALQNVQSRMSRFAESAHQYPAGSERPSNYDG